jgi:hypothetical protein
MTGPNMFAYSYMNCEIMVSVPYMSTYTPSSPTISRISSQRILANAGITVSCKDGSKTYKLEMLADLKINKTTVA